MVYVRLSSSEIEVEFPEANSFEITSPKGTCLLFKQRDDYEPMGAIAPMKWTYVRREGDDAKSSD